MGARVDQEMGRFLSRIWLEAEDQFSGFCGVEKRKKIRNAQGMVRMIRRGWHYRQGRPGYDR